MNYLMMALLCGILPIQFHTCSHLLQRILSEADLFEACACEENENKISQAGQSAELAKRPAGHEEEGSWGEGSDGDEEANGAPEDDEDMFSDGDEDDEAAAAAAAASESGTGKINAEVFNMPL